MTHYLIIKHQEPWGDYKVINSYERWGDNYPNINAVLADFAVNGDTYWQLNEADYLTYFESDTVPSSGGTIYEV